MTIRLLRPFNGYPQDAVVTFDQATEVALVNSLAATRAVENFPEFGQNGPLDNAPTNAINVGSLNRDPNSNSSVLQVALNSQGSISLTGVGTVELARTLIIRGNTRLNIGKGVKLLCQKGRTFNLIRNFATTRVRVPVSSFTSTLAIGTIGITNNPFSVGDWIWVSGSTSTGYNGVFQVLTATSSQVTVRLPFVPVVGTALGTISVVLADTDIEIFGGGNFDNGANLSSNPGTLEAHSLVFNGVENFKLDGITTSNCHKYGVLVGAVTNSTISNLTFDNTVSGSDGLHFQGPAFNVVAQNFYGVTGDDFVSLTIGDFSQWEISRGDYSNVLVGGIYATYCAKNLTKYAGNTPFKADNLTFDGVYGTCELTAVNIIDDITGGSLLGTTAGSIVCRNIAANHLTTNAAVEVRIGGRIDNLLIENVDGTLVGATSAVKLSKAQAADTTTLGVVKIRNLYNRVAPAGGFSGVGINGLGTAFTIDTLDVDADLRLNTGHGIALNSDTDLTVISRLKLSGSLVGPGGGSQACDGIRQDKGTITNLMLNGISAFGLRMVFEQSTPTAGGIATIDNIVGDGLIRLAEFRAGTLITLGQAVTLRNPTSAGNAPIRAVNAGTFRVEGCMLASGSTTADIQGVTNVGTPTLSLKGYLRADGDEVNGPAAGDMFYNTDAAWGSGSGVDKKGLYGYTGAAWTKIFGPA